MGKRKERRLAAKMGAGRRVKLDLFAEPSGDLGGSSGKDEVGDNVDAKLDAELPNSPSSSGQQSENPLSLLGQYSDEELDEASNETASALDKSLVDDDNQTKKSIEEPFEEGEIGGTEDHSSYKAENQHLERDSAPAGVSQAVEANGVRSDVVASDDKCPEVALQPQDPVPEASDSHTAGGVSSCWKMVLHEESNRYYYWNTITGETSWEVPDALAQGTGLTNELEALGTEIKVSASTDVNAAIKLEDFSAMHGIGYTNGVPETAAVYEQGLQANQSIEQCKGDGSQLLASSTVVGVLPYEPPSLGGYSLSEQLNYGGMSSTSGTYEIHGHGTMPCELGAIDLPSHLVKHAEAMLERLNLLQGSGFDSDHHDLMSKYALEIEIRLSDIRTLLPYGSSLVPFWQHSERQLNQLENAIISEIGKQSNGINEMLLSSANEKDTKVEDRGGESNAVVDLKKSSPEDSCAALHGVDISSVVQKASHDGHPALVFGVEGGKEINAGAPHVEGSSKAESFEDVDMDIDIDMEVEDPSPARSRNIDMGQLVTPSEHLLQPNAPTAGQSLGPATEFIPPPPDEEWIPPPPPDDEGIPPPPPDEPPESTCPPPPSGLEQVQSIESNQYNQMYAESNLNYYGNTTEEASGSSFYEQSSKSQIAALSLPVYYAAVSDAQPTAVPNPAVYYGLQDASMPIVPVESTIGSSSFQASTGHLNHDPLSSDQFATVDASAGPSSLSNQFIDPLVPGAGTVIAPGQTSSTAVISAPATGSAKEYVAAPSFSASASVSITSTLPVVTDSSVSVTSTLPVVTDSSAAVSKVQSKATRTEKPKVTVASSLRSNKKVSSLVDKWKAAKEELEEEGDDEPETALEILEKKRRREIEEWRAQQLASGEARENANFQPLGGDWRARVKRRRAQKEAATEKSSDVNDGTKQPDLNELAKDLPPGWQAYWDDSSKQVYYGNSITSETTWTRPTR